MPWLIAGCYALIVLALFHETAWSMVTIWLRSETFTHCFLIVPIAAWLAWRDRDALARITPRPAPWVAVLTFGAGAAWLLASLVDVLVVQQLALVALLVTGFWALLGTPLARRLSFPFGFLFLAVPMGLSLEDPMMDLTADWTVGLIRQTGIPVYQEGRFFELPSGRWSVVEACSGVRYLIASFTLGLIYSYITYVRLFRRLLFIAASLIVPVVANVLRAWGIVMIGHFSGMKYATGVDHLIYGWVFFGLVMLLLFWLGGFWQEPPPVQAKAAGPDPAPRRRPRDRRSFVGSALLLLACAVAAPLLGVASDRAPALVAAAPLASPAAASGWVRVEAPVLEWRPGVGGADRRAAASYHRAGDRVDLFLYQYLAQQQGVEMVTHGEPWSARGAGWRVTERGRADTVPASEVVLSNPRSGERLLAWSWYRVDGRNTPSDYLAKVLEAWQQLRFAPRNGTRLFLATPSDGDTAAARERLAGFLAAHEGGLAAALRADLRKESASP